MDRNSFKLKSWFITLGNNNLVAESCIFWRVYNTARGQVPLVFIFLNQISDSRVVGNISLRLSNLTKAKLICGRISSIRCVTVPGVIKSGGSILKLGLNSLLLDLVELRRGRLLFGWQLQILLDILLRLFLGLWILQHGFIVKHW